MKKIVLVLSLIAMLGLGVNLQAEERSPGPEGSYPEYTGDINDPECLVMYEGNGYIIVRRGNKTYIVYL